MRKKRSTELRQRPYLADDPCQPEEKHDPPNVEQAPHVHTLDPTELDDLPPSTSSSVGGVACFQVPEAGLPFRLGS